MKNNSLRNVELTQVSTKGNHSPIRRLSQHRTTSYEKMTKLSKGKPVYKSNYRKVNPDKKENLRPLTDKYDQISQKDGKSIKSSRKEESIDRIKKYGNVLAGLCKANEEKKRGSNEMCFYINKNNLNDNSFTNETTENNSKRELKKTESTKKGQDKSIFGGISEQSEPNEISLNKSSSNSKKRLGLNQNKLKPSSRSSKFLNTSNYDTSGLMITEQTKQTLDNSYTADNSINNTRTKKIGGDSSVEKKRYSNLSNLHTDKAA